MKKKEMKNKNTKGQGRGMLAINWIRSKSVMVGAALISLLVLLLGMLMYFQWLAPVAKVNGQSISRVSFIDELENRAGAELLDALIVDILIEQAATEAGIDFTDIEIENEITLLETQITSQGSTLEDVLKQEGLNRENLGKQIRSQKILSTLLAGNITVTEEDVEAFLEANGPLPEGQEDELRPQIVDQVRNQKFSTAVQSYVVSLRTKADINYYANYE